MPEVLNGQIHIRGHMSLISFSFGRCCPASFPVAFKCCTVALVLSFLRFRLRWRYFLVIVVAGLARNLHAGKCGYECLIKTNDFNFF